MIQNQLFNNFKIDSSNLTLEQLKKFSLHEKTLNKLANKVFENAVSMKLGLREGLELLAELNDELGRELLKMYWKKDWKAGLDMDVKNDAGPLLGWLNQRNRSFLAHGTIPAKKEPVESMLKDYYRLLRQFIPTDKMVSLEKAAMFIKF